MEDDITSKKQIRYTTDVELLDIEQTFNALTAPLVLSSGSIFRIPSQSLENWGIGITPKNRELIRYRSKLSFQEEWRESSSEINDAIATAMRDSAHFTGDGNTHLNRIIASQVVDILLNLFEIYSGIQPRRISILDLGAGSGATTLAILDLLAFKNLSHLAHNCHFYLLEPSLDRLREAQDSLKHHTVRVDYELVASDDDTHLPRLAEGVFDIVISSAVFHHKSFPDYLFRLNNILSGNQSALVFGDWYHTLWEHPARVVPVLKVLGADDQLVSTFMGLFNVTHGDVKAQEQLLTLRERVANGMMLDYLAHLKTALIRVRERIGERKLHFLEAHESLRHRVNHLNGSGFTISPRELRESYQAFKHVKRTVFAAYRTTNLASVIVAGKKQRALVKA